MSEDWWTGFHWTFFGLSAVSLAGGLVWLTSGFTWWGFILALGGGLLLAGGVLVKAVHRRRVSRD